VSPARVEGARRERVGVVHELEVGRLVASGAKDQLGVAALLLTMRHDVNEVIPDPNSTAEAASRTLRSAQ